MNTKRCPDCGETKPKSAFWKSKSRYDGLQSFCSACQSAYQASGHGQKIRRKALSKYNKSEKGKAADQRRMKRYPEHTKARNAVSSAIQSGRMKPAKELVCTYCPNPANQYHHHKGYAPENVLDVISICSECHKDCNHVPELEKRF